jgi:hypothetical protein
MTGFWHRRVRAGRNQAAATGWVAAAGMTAVMLLAACGSKSGQQSTATPTPTAAAEASASGTSTCMSQFTTWRDGGGIADIPALTGAVTDFETSAVGASLGVLSDADVARLKTAAASLLAAAKRGQANPPPSCVPGLRADHKAAMAGFKKGAQGAVDAVKAARNGDTQTAASEIKAAAKKLEAGSKAMDAAVTDMETFEASG